MISFFKKNLESKDKFGIKDYLQGLNFDTELILEFIVQKLRSKK
jgi:hypothetical protein